MGLAKPSNTKRYVHPESHPRFADIPKYQQRRFAATFLAAIVDINSYLTPNLYQYEIRIGFYRMISPYSACRTYSPREVESDRPSTEYSKLHQCACVRRITNCISRHCPPIQSVGCRPQLETEREEYRAYFKSITFKLLNCRCDTQFSSIYCCHKTRVTIFTISYRPFGMQLA